MRSNNNESEENEKCLIFYSDSISAGGMPSDLLITGPMGCGKTVTARVVLKHYVMARARVEDR